MNATLEQLRRKRWGLRLALTLPVGATIAGNVLHAQPTTVGRIISAWAPLALLITIEIATRTPGGTAVVQRAAHWLGSAAIAGIAAWVSYWHLAAVCARYGEDGVAAHILPLSVDGLVVVISVRLVVISGLIRALEAATLPAAAPAAGQPARDLPAPPGDLPGIDPAGQLRALAVVRDTQPDPAPATDPVEIVADPDPLLEGIAEKLGHLPAPPGRPSIQDASEAFGKRIGSTRADRIRDTLAAGPWPPGQAYARDLPAPALAGQNA